jgi:hypothetical protein
MNKVVIFKDNGLQVVFVGTRQACEQYMRITHPNGKFIDLWGNEWKVKIV